ncbi:hypothetical protein RJT34_16374 [Clitoria ternatea]|uniref:Uncharacterized protein n=1 Tax=Clitoria ternatea TaxID=43366 RepID=A0AAN9PDL9_CLITE
MWPVPTHSVISDFTLENQQLTKAYPQRGDKHFPVFLSHRFHVLIVFDCEKSTMPTLQMASHNKLRYQRLRHGNGSGDERDRVNQRPKSWFRFRFRRVPIRRRFRLKIPSLRRLWRKRARLVSYMRNSCGKVMKRFKDGQVHFGDLFAGNYLFMQVNPASLKCLERDFSLPKIAYI